MTEETSMPKNGRPVPRHRAGPDHFHKVSERCPFCDPTPVIGGSVEGRDALIEAALYARVPGGSEVWVWLPQKDGWTPHQTAREVMGAAVDAILARLTTSSDRHSDSGAGRFWLIVHEPGKVPVRKGPWLSTGFREVMREFIKANSTAYLTVLTVDEAGVPDVQHGPEALQIADGRSMSVGRAHNARTLAAHTSEPPAPTTPVVQGERAGRVKGTGGVVAFSTDLESRRVLKLHFDHDVTDADRAFLLEAFNARYRLATSPDNRQLRKALIEKIAEHLYTYVCGSGMDAPGWVPWVPGGNSQMQDQARQRAANIIDPVFTESANV